MTGLQIFFSIISVLLIVVILLQQKNSSLGSMAGQDAGETIVKNRRGAEQFLHKATIFLGIIFLGGGIYLMAV